MTSPASGVAAGDRRQRLGVPPPGDRIEPPRLEVMLLAGAGLNVAVGTEGQDADLARVVPQSVHQTGSTTVRIYPGLILGLQI